MSSWSAWGSDVTNSNAVVCEQSVGCGILTLGIVRRRDSMRIFMVRT